MGSNRRNKTNKIKKGYRKKIKGLIKIKKRQKMKKIDKSSNLNTCKDQKILNEEKSKDQKNNVANNLLISGGYKGVDRNEEFLDFFKNCEDIGKVLTENIMEDNQKNSTNFTDNVKNEDKKLCEKDNNGIKPQINEEEKYNSNLMENENEDNNDCDGKNINKIQDNNPKEVIENHSQNMKNNVIIQNIIETNNSVSSQGPNQKENISNNNSSIPGVLPIENQLNENNILNAAEHQNYVILIQLDSYEEVDQQQIILGPDDTNSKTLQNNQNNNSFEIPNNKVGIQLISRAHNHDVTISQCNNFVELPDDEPENFNYIGDDDNSNGSNDLSLENNVNFSNIGSLQLNHEGTNWKID